MLLHLQGNSMNSTTEDDYTIVAGTESAVER